MVLIVQYSLVLNSLSDVKIMAHNVNVRIVALVCVKVLRGYDLLHNVPVAQLKNKEVLDGIRMKKGLY